MKFAELKLEDICVAGITPFTTIDFPGRLAGVFYLQGCPWRCRYCYNPEFWSLPSELRRASPDSQGRSSEGPSEKQDEACPSSQGGHRISFEKILQFLESRSGRLDGIVFSGGEPTIHERLSVWMRAVKEMGFQIGLHTGGMFPERLRELLPFCDWVGMDIKAPFGVYEKVTGVAGSGVFPRQSVSILIDGKVPSEFRTTVHPEILSELEILEMARELSSLGVKKYVLQSFRSDHCPDKQLRESELRSLGVSASLRAVVRPMFEEFSVRE